MDESEKLLYEDNKITEALMIKWLSKYSDD